MSGAQLVIARIGKSQSLVWEVRTAAKLVKPERLLFLVPSDRDSYEQFRTHVRDVLPSQLPDYGTISPGSAPPAYYSIAGLIYFNRDWTPQVQRIKRTYVRQTYWRQNAASLKIALRPVYERLGVNWICPPIQISQIIPLTALALFALIAIYGVIEKVLDLVHIVR